MKQARRRMTYANVISTLALFIALSGATAFATGQLGPKSVGEKQLRPGAVTADKLRKNAVTAPKIKALAVKEGKIAAGAVNASKIAGAAVTADKIAGGAVANAALAAGAVTGDKVDEATLGQVPSAARSDLASFADSSNPAAFAKISSGGVLDTALSKGVGPGDVTLGSENGIYCVRVPGFSPRGAQVTVEYGGSSNVTAYVDVRGAEGCPAPGVQVQTFSSGLHAKVAFYIALYR